MSAVQACPCGRMDAKKRTVAYTECCGRFIDHWDSVPAPDAAHLMRSRYTAFVREHAAYLLATWHASTRPASLDFDAQAKWLGLEVRDHRMIGDNAAEVTFVARYRLSSGAVRMHECSRFVHEDGRWFYVDGDTL
jgi:SEC-C motif-containing protein